MILIGILVSAMVIGAAAQWVLGQTGRGVDWTRALITALAGSFVGGMLASTIFGDGFALRPSGFIGSFVGAVILTAALTFLDGRK